MNESADIFREFSNHRQTRSSGSHADDRRFIVNELPLTVGHDLNGLTAGTNRRTQAKNRLT